MGKVWLLIGRSLELLQNPFANRTAWFLEMWVRSNAGYPESSVKWHKLCWATSHICCASPLVMHLWASALRGSGSVIRWRKKKEHHKGKEGALYVCEDFVTDFMNVVLSLRSLVNEAVSSKTMANVRSAANQRAANKNQHVFCRTFFEISTWAPVLGVAMISRHDHCLLQFFHQPENTEELEKLNRELNSAAHSLFIDGFLHQSPSCFAHANPDEIALVISRHHPL